MAQIGLRYLRYSELDEEGNYSGAKKLAKAIESKVSLNIAEGKLYADDTISESAKMFTSGTVDLTVDDDPDEVFAPLLGHKYDPTTKEVVKFDDDVAPFVGVGGIKTKVVNNERKYKAEFYPKVKFKDSIPDGKTKGESIEFQTPTLSGDIFAKEVEVNGETKNMWSKTATLNTLKEAEEYLDELMKAKE